MLLERAVLTDRFIEHKKDDLILIAGMPALSGIGYLLIAFSPTLVIFQRVIASDPLRVILFVLGAFFWLLSLLLSAIIWFAVVPLRDYLIFSICVSVALQEGARIIYFLLLKKAQKGLSRMTAKGFQIAGVHTLRDARHLLAVVCGLGMGVMAAFFLVVNVIADFWGSGTVGLPATIPNMTERFTVKLYAEDLNFPITYSISAFLLTLLHVFWTVLIWDGCHKMNYKHSWWIGVLFAVASHYAVSIMSFWNCTRWQPLVMSAQAIILILDAILGYIVMGGNWMMLKQSTKLAWKRSPFAKLFQRSNNVNVSSDRGSNTTRGAVEQYGPLHVDA